MTHDANSALVRGRECIRIEMEALQATAEALDASFVAVVEAVEAAMVAGRKLIFSGVGKSAHIAQKLAGTFNSTGVTSCFLDATQALHGDLGLCAPGDLAVLLSNSGQSAEMLRLLAILKRFELTIVALTSNPDSEIARDADLRLLYRVPREACPLRLAPTASTTAALAMGDALAMVLLERRGFTRDDFARLHPSGNLGTALLLKVTEIMRTGDRLPVMSDQRTIQDAILGMTKAKAGCIALVDEVTGKLSGILTDGDFRRHVLSSRDFLAQPVAQFMTRTPKTVPHAALAVEALRVFDHYKIDDLIVVDEAGRPVGLVDVQDLPKMKLL
ncbi:MAG TPA: KpsF/GutQ family sugar-phosphate isomerase [Opitutaceae bacterium]|nr:KpsF/GutQ family sugar-phosphate isomerase [Opitutaceae bacterium]